MDFWGGSKKHLQHTHSLAGGRGVVGCWKCGKYAVTKPSKLVLECKPPTDEGRRNLSRLRKGRPPVDLKDWPSLDNTMFRKLMIVTDNKRAEEADAEGA